LGGLYVSTGYGQRQFVPLYSGDAIIHQSTLLHGVQVLDVNTTNGTTIPTTNTTGAERWSWILWYRDSVQCNDYSYEWFADCANRGDAICQELHATKIGNIPLNNNNNKNETDDTTTTTINSIDPKVQQHYIMESIVQFNRKSAEQGNGYAAIKMARAYLKLLPSSLVYNKTEAIRYYKLAIQSNHPDGYYGMANLYLESIQSSNDPNRRSQSLHHYNKTLSKVVRLLEEGAIRGHAYSMFNLGIVHCYGYGVSQIDTELAALWFVQCGLPEGYYAASYYAALIGNTKQQEQYDRHARVLGYYEPWRKLARQRTGSGGASGVDINTPWPKSRYGRTPPIF
jgi:TPR repeat protein